MKSLITAANIKYLRRITLFIFSVKENNLSSLCAQFNSIFYDEVDVRSPACVMNLRYARAFLG